MKGNRAYYKRLKKILGQKRNWHTSVVHLPRTGVTKSTISRLFRGTVTSQFKVLQKKKKKDELEPIPGRVLDLNKVENQELRKSMAKA